MSANHAWSYVLCPQSYQGEIIREVHMLPTPLTSLQLPGMKEEKETQLLKPELYLSLIPPPIYTLCSTSPWYLLLYTPCALPLLDTSSYIHLVLYLSLIPPPIYTLCSTSPLCVHHKQDMANVLSAMARLGLQPDEHWMRKLLHQVSYSALDSVGEEWVNKMWRRCGPVPWAGLEQL